MEEYRKALEEFRNVLNSLGPACEDVKDQGIEILDNPEGPEGVLSPEQYNKLMSLLDIGEEDLNIQIDELTEENQVIESFIQKMDKEGKAFDQNMNSLVQNMQEATDSSSSTE